MLLAGAYGVHCLAGKMWSQSHGTRRNVLNNAATPRSSPLERELAGAVARR